MDVLRFAEEKLGPATCALLSEPEGRAFVREKIGAGAEPADAVLAFAHRQAAAHPRVADEFTAFFLADLLRLGRGRLSAGLRRFLDTGDLVQSVFGDLWPELAGLEFRTRAQFLSLLAGRLRWKIADRDRAFRGPRRREDRREALPPEDAVEAGPGGSPASLAASAEERERLILVLLRLPPRDRRLLTLFLKGEPVEAIAREEGLALDAARKALQRAIRRARALVP